MKLHGDSTFHSYRRETLKSHWDDSAICKFIVSDVRAIYERKSNSHREFQVHSRYDTAEPRGG
jgi:hypothetical protein